MKVMEALREKGHPTQKHRVGRDCSSRTVQMIRIPVGPPSSGLSRQKALGGVSEKRTHSRVAGWHPSLGSPATSWQVSCVVSPEAPSPWINSSNWQNLWFSKPILLSSHVPGGWQGRCWCHFTDEQTEALKAYLLPKFSKQGNSAPISPRDQPGPDSSCTAPRLRLFPCPILLPSTWARFHLRPASSKPNLKQLCSGVNAVMWVQQCLTY